jgi:hypothetical protein
MSEHESAGAEAGIEPQDMGGVVAELHTALERASELIHRLRRSDGSPPPTKDPGAEKLTQLKQRLATAETELTELSDRLVRTEHQRGRLMNLYVATYQLHATLDLDEVKATIGEIARDLLGAERFLLLIKDLDSGEPAAT